ncbi:hypothetical protein BKN38_00150 [Helicobacter sp. CLO-3]|uniref:glycosyltransferase family 9 protein n=1 Tax=unclassified Helicobacter TaxID=2593540 RepID=UPI0008DAF907|nr:MULTISPECIES: glycosyltransferase family 9 protein [unclassified Helicobacter]OHU85854.1 hypothetical protein BKN38_00150 [Helicobacter sp. CLO-3]
MRIGIVRLSSFGDVVVSASVLGAFRRALLALDSRAKIEWFVDERFAGILADSACIDALHALPMRRIKSAKAAANLWRYLRAQGQYDVLLDLQGLLKSAIVGKAIRAKCFIGFGWSSAREGAASLLYTKRVQIAYDANILTRNARLCEVALEVVAGCVLESRESGGLESKSLDSGAVDSAVVGRMDSKKANSKKANSVDLDSVDFAKIDSSEVDFAQLTRENIAKYRAQSFGINRAKIPREVLGEVIDLVESSKMDSGKNAAKDSVSDFVENSIKDPIRDSTARANASADTTTSQNPPAPNASANTSAKLYKALFVLEASIREKIYPAASYAALARDMASALRAQGRRLAVFIIYNDDEKGARDFYNMLSADAPSDTTNAPESSLMTSSASDSSIVAHILPKLDFNALKFTLASMDCVVGGDTGVTHLAWALGGAEIITLFGNSATSSGKNMRATKIERVLLGNPYLVSQSARFEIASIPPAQIFTLWQSLESSP